MGYDFYANYIFLTSCFFSDISAFSSLVFSSVLYTTAYGSPLCLSAISCISFTFVLNSSLSRSVTTHVPKFC